MPFLARYGGICTECGKPFSRGEPFGWRRRTSDGKKHFGHAACFGYASTIPETSTTEIPESLTEEISVATLRSEESTVSSKSSVIELSEAEAAIKAALDAKTKKLMRATSPWYDVLASLLKPHPADGLPICKKVILIGPPGTGKTRTSAIYTGCKYSETLSEGSGEENLKGMFHLIKGETKWVDGPGTCALREGTNLQLNEIGHESPEVTSLLYAFLDDNPAIMLPTGEIVTAKDGYSVVATANDNVSTLTDAIVDRFEVVLLAVTPHPDALKGLDAAEQFAVSNFYRALDVTPWNWSGKPTVRRVRAFSRIKKAEIFSDELIAKIVFGESGREVLSTLATASVTAR